MIKPGQKLKEGDYFQGGTVEQYYELFKTDGFVQDGMDTWEEANRCFNDWGGIIYDPNYKLQYLRLSTEKIDITEHTFPDFKQLCENTFGV